MSLFGNATVARSGGITAVEEPLARAAGQDAAERCLQVQSAAEARDYTLRVGDRVRLHPDARPAFERALGEIELGLVLAMLGSEWTVLHAVPLGPSAVIGHLLIGPTGVYALSTEHHRGLDVRLDDDGLVAGSRRHPTIDCAFEAVAVGSRLAAATGVDERVIPVTVVVGERTFTDGRTDDCDQPHIVSSRDLLSWLQWRPAAESPTRLRLARLAAEERRTWHPKPAVLGSAATMTRFARLAEGVSRSERHLGSYGRTIPTVPTTVDPGGIDAAVDAIVPGATAVAAPLARRSRMAAFGEGVIVTVFGVLPTATVAMGLAALATNGFA